MLVRSLNSSSGTNSASTDDTAPQKSTDTTGVLVLGCTRDCGETSKQGQQHRGGGQHKAGWECIYSAATTTPATFQPARLSPSTFAALSQNSHQHWWHQAHAPQHHKHTAHAVLHDDDCVQDTYNRSGTRQAQWQTGLNGPHRTHHALASTQEQALNNPPS